MILFPAIDLIAGQVVRLERGDRSRMDVYSKDPGEVARAFRDAGATWIHVVDLSSAFGEDNAAREANALAIRAVASTAGIRVDAGGGVRTTQDIERLLELGVSRVAVGTALVRDPDFAAKAAAYYGDALVGDVAGRDGKVRISGWREDVALSVDELVARLAGLGFRHLVYTDIARDGMQTGIDPLAYRHVAAVAGFPVVASGGIATLDDLRELATLGDEVLEGAITGRALYEHAFTLKEALAAVG